MKEIMAVIRMNMISKTKDALLKEGYPCMTVRKVLGRGKKKIDFSLISDIVSQGSIESPVVAEQLSEGHRLISKRMITMMVQDEDVKKVVECLMSVNQTGNPGDGKIFVFPLVDAIRVRTGESGEDAV